MPAPQVTPFTSSRGPLQHALEHALRAAHFPQHIDIDRALAAGDLEGAPDLRNAALDGVADQLLMAFAAGAPVIDLRDDVAVLRRSCRR